jgi:hypothetical protein
MAVYRERDPSIRSFEVDPKLVPPLFSSVPLDRRNEHHPLLLGRKAWCREVVEDPLDIHPPVLPHLRLVAYQSQLYMHICWSFDSISKRAEEESMQL